ncbi:MAG: hypothetical protein FJ044_05510 [Candidatus Cloacimonetes bacterium]|nr:hypothetical protein [Candidatus Cloacimonadota bacterium]
MKLLIKYKSQHDPDAQKARGDCMEACLAMMASYLFDKDFSVDKVVGLAGPDLDKTSISDALMAGEAMNMKLTAREGQGYKDIEECINQRRPAICIINYERITNRQDQNYKGGHAVLVIGVDGNYIINDPDHWGNYRKTDIINKIMFENAWHSTAPKNICKNGTMIIPLKGKEGGDEEMELQKEIDRLAAREKELVGWLDDCNEKREDWEGKAKAFEYEKAQANNDLGEAYRKISELEVKIAGTGKEIEQWKKKYLVSNESEQRLVEEIKKIRTEETLKIDNNMGVIENLRSENKSLADALKTQKRHIEELEAQINGKPKWWDAVGRILDWLKERGWKK